MKSHNEESGATGVQNGHAARESHSYGSTQGIHIHHMRILWPIPHLLYSLIESYMFCSQKWHILDDHKRTFVTSWPFLAHLAFCL